MLLLPERASSARVIGACPWMNSAPSSMGAGRSGSLRVHTRPPTRSRASSSRTERPAAASSAAAASPAAPAPITMTSKEGEATAGP